MEFVGYDGKPIYVREWKDAAEPKGVVQIVHGMAEHSARYDKFARYLNERGYLVFADDHRGHGQTDPDALGYAEGDMFSDTVRDEEGIVRYLLREYPGIKHFLFGFSYGSFLTQTVIARVGGIIDGAAIGGSSHKKDFEVYLGSFVAGAGCIFGAKKPGKLIEKLSFGAYAKKFDDGQWLSTDPENNAAYAADPLSGFTCSNRFYRDFFMGLRRLYTRDYISDLNLDLPVLLVSGAQDPVGNMGKGVEKLRDFYRDKAKMRDVRMILFENSRHEFLNERENRAEKWAAIPDFFDEICAK